MKPLGNSTAGTGITVYNRLTAAVRSFDGRQQIV